MWYLKLHWVHVVQLRLLSGVGVCIWWCQVSSVTAGRGILLQCICAAAEDRNWTTDYVQCTTASFYVHLVPLDLVNRKVPLTLSRCFCLVPALVHTFLGKKEILCIQIPQQFIHSTLFVRGRHGRCRSRCGAERRAGCRVCATV